MANLGAALSDAVLPITSVQLGQVTDIGSRSLDDGTYLEQFKRLTISSTNRLIMVITARVLLYNFGITPNYVGSPKTPNASFAIPSGYFFDLIYRLNLNLNMRASIEGDADLILTDDFKTRRRIILSG